MGLSNSKSEADTINWNNIKTEEVSSSMHNFNGLSNEAKNLISSLNVPHITESEVSEFTVNHILDRINTGLNKDDQARFNELLDKVSTQTASEDLSNTSPFISSEMYDYLINNRSSDNITSDNGQRGGAKKSKSKNNKKKGGALVEEDSDTSSTSSDSELEDLLDSNEQEVKAEKVKKEHKNDKDKKHKKSESSDSEMSGGNLSYLSSSAHTGREFSDSQSAQDSNDSAESSNGTVESSSNTMTSRNSTVTDENANRSATVSVNTEDINMISDY